MIRSRAERRDRVTQFIRQIKINIIVGNLPLFY